MNLLKMSVATSNPRALLKASLAWVTGLAMALTITGCSTPYKAITKTAKVWWDPEVQVGEREELPSEAALILLASPDVNPNSALEPTPIAFQVFELRDSSRLMAADFEEMLESPEEKLGRNYLRHWDYTLVPSQYKYVTPFELDSETRFIGVVAYYAFPNESQWKKVVKVNPIGKDYRVLLNFQARDVVLQSAEDQ